MGKVLADRIQNMLLSQRSEMVQFVERLTLMESPSTVPDSQRGLMDLIGKELCALDYGVTHIPGRETGGFLYARTKERDRSRPIQLLVGHCDTVWPLNTLKTMPVVSDNKTIKGPGVYDMKGGLTQMIFALRAFKQLAPSPQVIPVVLINSDEEIGSRESTASIRRLARLSDRAFILEPSMGLQGKLKTRRKGVGRFTIKVKGRSAHAGLDPEAGASAIVELSFIIQELFKMNDPKKHISVNVGMVEGGLRANIVAEESKAVVDVRVPTREDADRITKMIYDLKPLHPEVKLEVSGSIGRVPMEQTPLNRRLWEKARAMGNLLGVELEEAFAGGASDGNTTSQYTATLDGLGATGDGAHAAHEFLYIDKMLERTALLTLLLMLDPVK